MSVRCCKGCLDTVAWQCHSRALEDAALDGGALRDGLVGVHAEDRTLPDSTLPRPSVWSRLLPCLPSLSGEWFRFCVWWGVENIFVVGAFFVHAAPGISINVPCVCNELIHLTALMTCFLSVNDVVRNAPFH